MSLIYSIDISITIGEAGLFFHFIFSGFSGALVFSGH